MVKLNNEQEYAKYMMNTGHNIFITGGAGVGKTLAIQEFIRESQDKGKGVMVVAPTGIAALNIGGVTIHRQFKASGKPLINKTKIDNEVMYALENTDIIIIDEISMCRIDLFDYMLRYITEANCAREFKRKGRIQVIISGDFFQLPPVTLPDERALFEKYYGLSYGSGFCFNSMYWNALDLKYVVLTKVERQSDSEFANALNMVRMGRFDGAIAIENLCSKKSIDKAINLYGRNSDVDSRNNEELDKIQGFKRVFLADIKGEAKIKDTNMIEELAVKVGARVVALTNSEEYVNGSLGTIVSIDESVIKVRFDNGFTSDIERYEQKVYKYKLDENKKLQSEEVGSIKQFPLKLAYAVTIHKSQGQTYDSMNLNPESWDSGQLYVALSRVKSLDGLYLTRNITPRDLVISREVICFYNEMLKTANQLVEPKNIQESQYDNECNLILSKLKG